MAGVMITGISGQDGSYLAEQLLASGTSITGVIHPGEALGAYFEPIQQHNGCELSACDIADPDAFRRLLRSRMPEHVFHLAAVSSPAVCARDPVHSRSVNVVSIEVLADWLRRDSPDARVLTVSSCAIFGNPAESPQTEDTPTGPLSEYGRQKLVVRELAKTVRDSGHFMACAIPFNHESTRRSEEFVMAKVCRSAARIARGQQERLELGDLSARRDWGYAPEFATAFAWMLDIDRPAELLLASGEAHSVADLVQAAFSHAGLDPKNHVTSDPGLLRPDDPSELLGDPSRAWEELGWEPKTRFAALVPLLVDAALAELE